jgi:hypothetical protein
MSGAAGRRLSLEGVSQQSTIARRLSYARPSGERILKNGSDEFVFFELLDQQFDNAIDGVRC